MDIKTYRTVNSDLILILVVYSLLAMLSLKYFHFYMGADGISYVSIAQKIVRGELYSAINGYWSPFYSWLMVPFFLFGSSPYYNTFIPRVISLIAGFFSIIGIYRLASAFKIEGTTKRTFLISSVPVILSFAIYKDTPDMLLVTFLVFYFSIIFDEDYAKNLQNGLYCGILGGIGFLTKTYVLPFFAVHFLLFNFLYYFRSLRDRKKIIKGCILGLGAFLVISGLWVGILSDKYGEFTISTSSEYNHAIQGPEYDGHPVYYLGLIRPPNPSAVSIWEDPASVRLEDWSPFESWKYFKFQYQIFIWNLNKSLILIEYFSVLSFLIIIISLWFIFRPGVNKSVKERLGYLLVTMFIYIGGYLFIFVESRYLWPIYILLMLNGVYLIFSSYKSNIINLKFRNMLLILFIVSFSIQPCLLLLSYPENQESYNRIEIMKNDYGIHGNIASDGITKEDKYFSWEKTLVICYYLECQYFGIPKETNNSKVLESELLANGIDYYFVWNNSSNEHFSYYKEITNGNINGLEIYGRI